MGRAFFGLRNGIKTIAWIVILAMGVTLANADTETTALKLTGPDFPPYYDLDDDGQPIGHLVDLFDHIATNAGYTWTGTVGPAMRTVQQLSHGPYDSSILVINPSIMDSGNVVLSPRPVAEMVLNVYAHEDTPITPQWESFVGKRVLVMLAYGYGGKRRWLQDPESGVEMITVNQFHSALKMLERKRGDYALLYDVNYETALRSLGRRPIDLHHKTITRIPLYIQLNTIMIPDHEAVMEKLMASYDDLASRGIIKGVNQLPDRIINHSQ